MYLNPPTREQMQVYASRHYLNFTPNQLDEMFASISRLFGLVDFGRLGTLHTGPDHTDCSGRNPGRVPKFNEDPYNAIIRFCTVPGSESGPLLGMRIGIKDNIAVAGVPMTEGKRDLMRVPPYDATVVRRLLDAGAKIVAKTNINVGDDDFGATANPRNPLFWAGGSSSGSAAAVAAGIVDAALGTDTGGSIRNPAAFCGIVGMKPTQGIVPTFGEAHRWTSSMDCIGPLTKNVSDNAKILDVIRSDEMDTHQFRGAARSESTYLSAADYGISGLRIGVITESLEQAGCTESTLDAFDGAASTLAKLGADVGPVSVPLWSEASIIWWSTMAVHMTALVDSYGHVYDQLEPMDVDSFTALAFQYQEGTRQPPWLGLLWPLVYEHLQQTGPGLLLAYAHNLRLMLRKQIDTLLSRFDLLITPTTPTGPPVLHKKSLGLPNNEKEDPISENRRSDGMNNTVVNLTGHPALTIPSGMIENNLPTGVQLIGNRFDEYTIYRAAFSYESNTPWQLRATA